MSNEGKIACKICGAAVHAIQLHLKDAHPDEWDIQKYQQKFPGEPIFSEVAKKALAEAEAKKKAADAAAAHVPHVAMAGTATAKVTPLHVAHVKGIKKETKALHEVFGIPATKEALSTKGGPIPINVFSSHEWAALVPAIDPNYVFDAVNLKDAMMAKELNIPFYAWGHKGSGKTTLEEQICARTNHPSIRVQHTINTEEAHIVGQWTVKGGETVFLPGPLPLAMRYGWVYIADEYDRGLPGVLSVYQPVLEGKSLVIKEATGTEWGVVQPHEDFRFFATGNSNGSGDETGLYQSTQIQDSSNFDRFGVTVHVKYLDPKLEAAAIAKQAGINPKDAEKLVDFATRIRESYDAGNISDVVSTRTLIIAAKLGVRKASWRQGVALAFTNKLSKVDRTTVDGVAQRIFT